MKLWKKLLLWALMSLVIQITVLWFIDAVYLEKRGEVIEVTKYEEKDSMPLSKVLTTSGDITQIKFSSDCRYAAYLSEGNLKIIDIFKNSEDKLITKGKLYIEYYKWLPDRNMVIYAVREKVNGQQEINIETFDVETGVLRDYPQIKGIDSSDEVYRIEPSPLTNTVYVIIEATDGKSDIYKYDIVDNLSYVTSVKDMYSAYHLIHNDSLVLQNNENQIFKLDGDKGLNRIEVGFDKNSILLGTDLRGLIYIGELDEHGNISEIVFGGINDLYGKTSRTIKLKESILPGNIFITPDGGIYAVSLKKNNVLDVLSGTVIKYPGEFVQVAGKYVISMVDKKLRFALLPILQ